MHTTLVWASKGGSGKTTTLGNVGAALAVGGYNVLLVGLDPDGDLELLYGIDPEDDSIIRTEQLIADPSLSPIDAAVRVPLIRGASGRLRVLASTQRLEKAALPLAQRDYVDVRRILDHFEEEGEVDLALLDVPGARGVFVTAAARAADSILLPVQPGDFERAAVHRTLRQIHHDAGFALPYLGVVFTDTPERARALREHRAAFADEEIHCFEQHIRHASSIASDPSRGGPTVLSNRRAPVARDFKRLATEIVNRIADTSPAE